MKQRVPRRVGWIYFAVLLLSLHYALTVYINSNFLSQFFSASRLSALYTLGSCLAILGFILSPSLVRKFGNGRVLLSGILLEVTALVGLFLSTSAAELSVFFLMHQALPPLLLFGLDVFLEDILRTERVTGRVRSMYLTASNAAFLFSPFAASLIISASSYRFVYAASAVFCFLLFFIVGDELEPVRTSSLEQVSFRDTLRKIAPRRSLRIVIYLDYLLQCFYALMVIYMSLYLHRVIGFDWQHIGIMFTIMLIPFVIFEAPLGRLFDRNGVEIDTLVIGFTVMSVTLIMMSFVHTQNFLLWTLLLFLSRIGASFVEVSAEYSFFKRVTGRDAGFISIFRMAMPAAYVSVSFIAQIAFSFVTFETMFLVGGIVLLSGVFYSLLLRTNVRI